MHGSAAPRNNLALDIHAVDIAQYVLESRGPMDAMKLEKLCYYAQAWSLAWDRGTMFPEDIEAWADGPVIRSLYARHRGLYTVNDVSGNADLVKRDPVRVATLESILEFYADRSGRELSELTHVEDPWVITRAEAQAAPGQPCRDVIDRNLITRYYRSQMDHSDVLVTA